MTTLSEITNILANNRDRLAQKYPIRSLAIFGSYARNTQHEESDLDILVEFSGRIGIHFIDLADEIEQIVGIKVDLVSQKGINESYLKAIHDDLIYV